MKGWRVCIAIVIGSGAASSCSADEPDPPTIAVEVVASEQPEKRVTKDECISKQVQAELIACFRQLDKQYDEHLAELDAEIAKEQEEVDRLTQEADAAMERLSKRILDADDD